MRRSAAFLAASSLTVSLLAMAPTAWAAPSDWDLILEQDKPVILDQLVQDGVVLTRIFEAVVRKPSGKKVGVLVGHQERFDVQATGRDVETRMRTLVFDLRGGQIVAQGVAVYPVGEGRFRPGKAFRIAITGGTGEYAGVSGELVSILNKDGTYRQKFRFVD